MLLILVKTYFLSPKMGVSPATKVELERTAISSIIKTPFKE